MAQNHPTVQEDRLIYQLDGQPQDIMLGTSAWFAWLGLASTFTQERRLLLVLDNFEHVARAAP